MSHTPDWWAIGFASFSVILNLYVYRLQRFGKQLRDLLRAGDLARYDVVEARMDRWLYPWRRP